RGGQARALVARDVSCGLTVIREKTCGRASALDVVVRLVAHVGPAQVDLAGRGGRRSQACRRRRDRGRGRGARGGRVARVSCRVRWEEGGVGGGGGGRGRARGGSDVRGGRAGL